MYFLLTLLDPFEKVVFVELSYVQRKQNVVTLLCFGDIQVLTTLCIYVSVFFRCVYVVCVYIHTFFVSLFVAIDLYYTYPRALTCHFLTSFDALNLGLPELFFF